MADAVRFRRDEAQRLAKVLTDSGVSDPDDIDTSDWPQGLVDVAEVIGAELTLALCERFGGVEKYYIPKLVTSAGMNHPWAAILGEESWRKLCKAYGGSKISLPRGTYLSLKKRVILDLAADPTLSHRTIALRARATETYVRMVLRGLDVSTRQLELFPKR